MIECYIPPMVYYILEGQVKEFPSPQLTMWQHQAAPPFRATFTARTTRRSQWRTYTRQANEKRTHLQSNMCAVCGSEAVAKYIGTECRKGGRAQVPAG